MSSSRKKRQRQLISEIGKHNHKQLNTEITRANALKAKLERGEDISAEDEAWLLQMDASGQSATAIKNLTAPNAILKVNAEGKATGYADLVSGEHKIDSGEGGHSVEITPRMRNHTDVVDENGQAIVSESTNLGVVELIASGAQLTPLNGHSVEDALVALDIRNHFRQYGELSPNLAVLLDERGWNLAIPITTSDMLAQKKLAMRRRHDAKLFDLLLHSNDQSLAPQGTKNRVRRMLQQAHKFVLTSEAAERIAQAIWSYPELLVTNGQFAIPPFETTWIEFPAERFTNVLSGREAGYVMPRSDKVIGYLIHKNEVYVAATNEEGDPIFFPISYRLNQVGTLADEQKVCKFFLTSRAQLDEHLWGPTLYQRLGRRTQLALRRQHSIRCDYHDEVLDQLDVSTVGPHLFLGAAGELRNILGVLLALNQPAQYMYKTDVGHRRRLVAGKPKVFMAHSVIELTLDRKKVRRLLTQNKEKGSHASPRWHEVRGHFCHDKVARSGRCDHGGGEWWVEYEPHKWQCLNCDGKRWWREYPEGRGSAQIGFVRSQHLVKA